MLIGWLWQFVLSNAITPQPGILSEGEGFLDLEYDYPAITGVDHAAMLGSREEQVAAARQPAPKPS